MFNKPRALSVWPAQFCHFYLFQTFYEQLQLFLFMTRAVLCRIQYRENMIVKSPLLCNTFINVITLALIKGESHRFGNNIKMCKRII